MNKYKKYEIVCKHISNNCFILGLYFGINLNVTISYVRVYHLKVSGTLM